MVVTFDKNYLRELYETGGKRQETPLPARYSQTVQEKR